MTNEKLLTVAQVADWLTLSLSAVYQLVRARKIVSLHLTAGRKGIRFRRADVEAFLTSCEVRPEPKVPSLPAPARRRKNSRNATSGGVIDLGYVVYDPKTSAV